MVQVISDVQADITSHAGTTGAQVLSRVAHKRHQVKQAIGRYMLVAPSHRHQLTPPYDSIQSFLMKIKF